MYADDDHLLLLDSVVQISKDGAKTLIVHYSCSAPVVLDFKTRVTRDEFFDGVKRVLAAVK